jgi:hypothetical protein
MKQFGAVRTALRISPRGIAEPPRERDFMEIQGNGGSGRRGSLDMHKNRKTSKGNPFASKIFSRPSNAVFRAKKSKQPSTVLRFSKANAGSAQQRSRTESHT